MDITKLWIDSVTNLVLFGSPVAYAQERKFLENQVIIIPGETWAKGCSHIFADLGYSAKGNKMTQLKRNYYNEQSVTECQKIIQSRNNQEITSIGISTLGEAKKRSTQGHCIRGVVLNYFEAKVTPDKRDRLTIDVHYRTTELLRKFGADLVFLHKFLLPEILKNNPWSIKVPHEIRLHLSTCFFSALFMPVFFRFVDPVHVLKSMKNNLGSTNQFYKRCLFRAKVMLDREPEHYKFRSRRNMQELATGFLDSGKINRERLEKFIKEERL